MITPLARKKKEASAGYMMMQASAGYRTASSCIIMYPTSASFFILTAGVSFP